MKASRNDTIEVGFALDSRNREIWRDSGLESELTVSLKVAGAAVFSHNHPRSNPPSPEDVALAKIFQIGEVRASVSVDPLFGKGDFVVENLERRPFSVEEYDVLLEKLQAKIVELQPRYDKGVESGKVRTAEAWTRQLVEALRAYEEEYKYKIRFLRDRE